MKAAIETPSFINTASRAGVSEDERNAMVVAISAEPDSGDLIQGTGGCRKRRFAGRGKGKSGGYRTVHYNGADDVPVLLLVVIDKGERADLNQAERNELKKAMATYEKDYRAGQAAKVSEMKKGA
jgi:hypothetical protein